MTAIERREAEAALSDIDDIARRVQRSRSYRIASLMLMWWGPLTAIGYALAWAWPRQAGYVWIAINLVGVAGSFALSAVGHRRSGVRRFDIRMLTALLLFFAFGLLWSRGVVHLTPRQMDAFWPTYFMLAYAVVGIWIGPAFVAIGLGITALTLFGYFFIGDWFSLWMALVNSGGLLLGGLWMRRS